MDTSTCCDSLKQRPCVRLSNTAFCCSCHQFHCYLWSKFGCKNNKRSTFDWIKPAAVGSNKTLPVISRAYTKFYEFHQLIEYKRRRHTRLATRLTVLQWAHYNGDSSQPVWRRRIYLTIAYSVLDNIGCSSWWIIHNVSSTCLFISYHFMLLTSKQHIQYMYMIQRFALAWVWHSSKRRRIILTQS